MGRGQGPGPCGRGRLTGLALPSAGALLQGATIRRTEPAAGGGDSARRFGTQRVLVEPDAAAGKRPERGLPSARPPGCGERGGRWQQSGLHWAVRLISPSSRPRPGDRKSVV